MEKPSFHLTGGGLTTSLKVSSAFSSTPITLFIQMHGQPRFLVCLRVVQLITGHIERYTVDGHLTVTVELAHVCEP